MDKLKDFWDYIDGHKTNIGAAFFLVGKVLEQMGRPDAAQVFSTIGEFVVAGGLTHKLVKSVS